MSDPLDPVVDAVYPRIKKGTFVDPSSCKRQTLHSRIPRIPFFVLFFFVIHLLIVVLE
jgi:hypothetical protein